MLVRRSLHTVTISICVKLGDQIKEVQGRDLRTSFFSWRSECLSRHQGGDDPSDGGELHPNERLSLNWSGEEGTFALCEMCVSRFKIR